MAAPSGVFAAVRNMVAPTAATSYSLLPTSSDQGSNVNNANNEKRYYSEPMSVTSSTASTASTLSVTGNNKDVGSPNPNKEERPASRGMVVFSVLFYLVAALVMVSRCSADAHRPSLTCCHCLARSSRTNGCSTPSPCPSSFSSFSSQWLSYFCMSLQSSVSRSSLRKHVLGLTSATRSRLLHHPECPIKRVQGPAPSSQHQRYWSHLQHVLPAIRRRVLLPSRARTGSALHRLLFISLAQIEDISRSTSWRLCRLHRLLSRGISRAFACESDGDPSWRLQLAHYISACNCREASFECGEGVDNGARVLQQSLISGSAGPARHCERRVHDCAIHGHRRRTGLSDFSYWRNRHWRVWFLDLYRWLPQHQGDKSRHAYDLVGCKRCHSDFSGHVVLRRHHYGVSRIVLSST